MHNGRLFWIVRSGTGRETSEEQKFNQVTEARLMTSRELQDVSPLPDTPEAIPDELQSSERKGGYTDEAIIIRGVTVNFIMDRARSASAQDQ